MNHEAITVGDRPNGATLTREPGATRRFVGRVGGGKRLPAARIGQRKDNGTPECRYHNQQPDDQGGDLQSIQVCAPMTFRKLGDDMMHLALSSLNHSVFRGSDALKRPIDHSAPARGYSKEC